MDTYIQSVIFATLGAFLSTAGCSIIFNAPKKMTIINGMNGAIGYFIYLLLLTPYGMIPGTVLAGIIVTFVSEIVARIEKTPVTVCLVPSFYPLVPGLLLYRAVYSFLDNDLSLSSQYASQAFLVAGAIALSILLTESAFILVLRSAKKIRRRMESLR